MRALIAGASGFVGRRLAPALRESGWEVRALVRDPESAPAVELARIGCELRRGELGDPTTLEGSADGADVAYFLAHLMADGNAALGARERGSAGAFAREARRSGVRQMVYLGGLGDEAVSEHLTSRHATAEVLRAEGPPLTYFRAAMIVGAGSESYVLLKALVERLPAILAPDWLGNRTQPIGIESIVDYLVAAAGDERVYDREIELGGPEVMTYGEMLDQMARALGEPPLPKLPVRGLDADAAARGAAALTPGDPGVAAHITAGLATDTVVTDPSGAELFDVEPEPLTLTLARAIAEDEPIDGEPGA